eukprot:998985-Rhodomonas_salina.1
MVPATHWKTRSMHGNVRAGKDHRRKDDEDAEEESESNCDDVDRQRRNGEKVRRSERLTFSRLREYWYPGTSSKT